MELSLPTAVISAFIGSSVLLMALIYVSTTPGAPKGLSWWIAGMAMSCIRYATVYWILSTRNPAAIFVAESLQVTSAIALAAGGVEFLGRRVSKVHFTAVSAVAVAWAAYTTLVYPDFLLRAIPLYFTSGILLILVGIAFLRAQPTGQRSGYALTGILFMAWGLHKLDFPFLRPVQWFAPYGFLIAMILLMALAVSLIVVVQRRMLHVTENETRERQEAEAALSASERRFQRLFENSEVSLWNEDFSQVCGALMKLRQEGVEDLRAYLTENDQAAAELAGMVKVVNVNEATLDLFGAKDEGDLVENIRSTWGPGARDVFIEELCAIWEGKAVFRSEAAFRSLDGNDFDATISFQIPETEQGFSSIPVSIIDITERKRAHNLLRDAIESLGEGFSLWDRDDRFVLCNEKYRRSMKGLEDVLKPGLPFEEMVRALANRKLRPQAIGREDEWIKERLATRGKPGTSFEIQTADGAWIEVHEFGTSDGGIVTVRNEITDRKQAEVDAQRKAGEELALGNLLRLSIGNSALKDYLQDSIETLLDSVPWLNLLPSGGIFLAETDDGSEDILRLVAHHNFDTRLAELCAGIPFGKCHCGKAALTREVQFSSCVDDGHEITYEGIEQHGHYNVPILHNGAVLGVIVLYLPHDYPKDDRSVTFLKRVADVLSMGISARRTAQALGETEERFRTIVNNCPFAIFLKAPDGRYLFGNTEFLKWHDAEHPNNVVGKTSVEQFDAEGAAEMMEQDKAVLETRDVDVRQVVRKYRDDVTRHLLAIKFPIFDESGGVATIGCVDVDITRLKEAESELKLAMEEAERANRAKSEFLASMSHELRAPLNAVLGFAQMLQFNPKHPLTTDQNRHIEHILEGGGHLLDLVNEILDLAKIEGDQLALSLEEIDANEIVAECMVLAAPLGDQKQVTIVNALESGDSVILRTDPLRLKQALLNLLSNAIKFNRDGGMVTISGRVLEDEFLHLAVTDTGVGIEEAEMSNVFQMFHRLGADPTLTREGTGIGLTVTKHLVERLAGRIGFESEKGVGSTFWIDLPLAGNENVLIWTDTMQIGIDAIDKDHKHLISLLNRLSHGPLDDVDTDNTIRELIEYTRYHFRREEMIMDLGGYPGRDEHRLQHRALSADMAALAKRWNDGRDQKTFTELKTFLRNWLFQHIMKTDAEIRAYAKGNEQEIAKVLAGMR